MILDKNHLNLHKKLELFFLFTADFFYSKTIFINPQ